MTELSATPTIELADDVFDAASYALPIPTQDGYKATRLDIRFSGSGLLDRTSEDDLELLAAMRLGREVRLIVTGTIVGKGFRLAAKADDDAETSYACTVRVESVEAGEIA